MIIVRFEYEVSPQKTHVLNEPQLVKLFREILETLEGWT
jgi:hypothetical protein